jgi:uncharacterized protein (PEP-CTERM system associated)
MIGEAAGLASGRRRHADHAACTGIFVVAAVLGSSHAAAQSTWRIIPSITVAETLTDNVAFAPESTKESDLITQVTPAVRVTSQGRLRMNLSYRPTALFYANRSDQNTVQNYLDGTATYEAVQNWLYIDANASISQQSFSAFAPQSNIATENINANRVETMTYQVSPYVRGRFGANADYAMRYTYTASQTRGTDLGQTQVQDWLGTITSRPVPIGLGWALTANYQSVQPDIGRDTSARRVYGTLTYSFNPEIRAGILAGWETNNYNTTTDESAFTYGGQFEWMPTVRTRFNASYSTRPLTDTYEVGFSHRTRLTAWRISDTKTITTLPAQLVSGRGQSAFDLLFDALASQFPDPIARADAANRVLQQTGIPRDLALTPLFLSSRAFIQHARFLTFSLIGVRNTVAAAGSIVNTRSTDSGVPVSDSFSQASDVEQRTLTATWAHYLSAITTVNLLGSYTRNIGSGLGSADESKQYSARLTLTHQFSPRTYGTIGARYIKFDSTTTPANNVREKAILGSIAVTFY